MSERGRIAGSQKPETDATVIESLLTDLISVAQAAQSMAFELKAPEPMDPKPTGEDRPVPTDFSGRVLCSLHLLGGILGSTKQQLSKFINAA